jgi:hypothetical protein
MGGHKLCGIVNPHGTLVEGCRFELGTEAGVYKNVFPCSPEPPYSGEAPVEITATATGLGPNTTYHYRLALTDKTGPIVGQDEVFTTEPVAPAIQNVSATEITDETATLEAQINPENSETEYEVLIASPCGGPPDCILSSGKIIPSSGREYVRIELAGKKLNIEPNTTYEYWVIAKNSDAQKTEVRETFTTLKIPTIDSESVGGVIEHDAILEAKINPEGQDVRYQFQIARNASEFLPEMACPSRPTAGLCLGSPATAGALPIGFLIARSGDESVGLDLERETGVTLQAETTYHYRVIAVRAPLSEDTITWKGPPVYGADQTFTTQGARTGLGDLLTSGSSSGGSGNFAPQSPTVVKPKTPAQVRAAKLAKALKLCKKYHKKSKRAKCDKAARQKYGSLKTKHKRK